MTSSSTLPATGITIYGCGQDEAALFRELAPGFGVTPTITAAAVSEANAELASGNRCISVGHKTRITNATLPRSSQAGVTYISTRSIGYNHIDVEYAHSVGISVENVSYSPDSVADYTLMLMLMAVRHAKSIVRRTDVHDYRLHDVRGKELRDLTVGVVGTGRIGAAVMDRLRGFGCRVLAHDRSPKASRLTDYVPLDELLRHSDIVTLHTPLTAETHHLLDRHRIEQMKPGAFIINTGRGSLLDTEALVQALESGRLGGAALDVLEGEEGIFYADCRDTAHRKQNTAAAAGTAERAHQPAHGLLHRPRPERHRRELHHQLSEIREQEPSWRITGKLKIGIMFGGCSEEHPVSVKSAREVAKHLDPEKYEPFYIGITRSGAWKLCDGPDGDWEERRQPSGRAVSPDRNVHGLLVLDQGRYETISLDLVLPVLHGKLGEDGAIQGLLELSGIPYVGCDVQTSALCMDKTLTYLVVQNAGIATPRFWTFTPDEKIDPDELPYPVFVKPARSGSSFGVSKVTEQGRAVRRDRDRAALRREGAHRGGRRRQRDRLRRPGCGRGSAGRRGGPGRADARLLQDPPGERAGDRLGERDVHRPRRHPGASRVR